MGSRISVVFRGQHNQSVWWLERHFQEAESTVPVWRMKGEYLKTCNCVSSCPCDTMGCPAPHQYCEALFGMHILEGKFKGTNLKGLKWVGVVHFPGAMHEGNGDVEFYVDQAATPDQRYALRQILTGKVGGPFFEIIAAVCPNLKGMNFAPIQWQFDKAKRRAHVSIAGFIETTTEPLVIVPTREAQRVIVRMPNGFEYKEMEVAQAVTLQSTGAIKFCWRGTHSSLAYVVHTDTGLVA